MESTRDSAPSTRPASEIGPQDNAVSPPSSVSNAPDISSLPGVTTALETVTDGVPSQPGEDAVQPISDSADQPRPAQETEHAYWAEFEEDTTLPDEEELKEIDGADADYSACDRMSSAPFPSPCRLRREEERI